jgi:hypothetical protein
MPDRKSRKLWEKLLLYSDLEMKSPNEVGDLTHLNPNFSWKKSGDLSDLNLGIPLPLFLSVFCG